MLVNTSSDFYRQASGGFLPRHKENFLSLILAHSGPLQRLITDSQRMPDQQLCPSMGSSYCWKKRQPYIVPLTTGRITGYDSMYRWKESRIWFYLPPERQLDIITLTEGRAFKYVYICRRKHSQYGSTCC